MDMNIQIEILYPEHKMVSPRKLYNWACDAVSNGATVTTEQPATFAEAVAILEDCGYVTFHKDIDRWLNQAWCYEVFDNRDSMRDEARSCGLTAL